MVTASMRRGSLTPFPLRCRRRPRSPAPGRIPAGTEHRARSCWSGSVKAKVEPAPTRLRTQIRPPCSSMNRRATASPRPVPSAACAAGPTCRNSSNIASWCSGAMPTPVSATEISDHPVPDRGGHVDPAPLAGELDRVGQEVEEHLLHLALVGPDRSPRPLLDGVSAARCPAGSARSRTRISAFSSALGRSKSVRASSMRPPPSWRDRGCR